MRSSVEKAFPNRACIDDIVRKGGYDQVVGFNYDWTQGIEESGEQLAGFLDRLKGAGITEVDVEAHSEGVPVSLSAFARTSVPVRNMVLLGGPIMGTPAASRALLAQYHLALPSLLPTTLLNWGQEDPRAMLMGRGDITLKGVLNGRFAQDLQPDSDTLKYIRGAVAQKMGRAGINTKLIAVAGTDYTRSPEMKALGDTLRETGAFFNERFDGIVGENSALGLTPDGKEAGLRMTPLRHPVSHTDLECDPQVIQAVGNELRLTGQLASVQLDPPTASIVKGKNQLFRPVARDASGRVLDDLPPSAFTWSSANPAIATVDASGLTDGKSTGTTVITASIKGITAEGITATATVSVTPRVVSVQLDPPSASIVKGKNQLFRPIAKDANGRVLDDLTASAFTWSSANPAIATVDASGFTDGKSAGTTTITASIEGIVATATVSVTPRVVSAQLDPASATILQGKNQLFRPIAKDANGRVLDDLTASAFTWSSANPAIATVDASGFTDGKSAGTTTITASIEGIAGTATVSVTPPVAATLSVSPTSITSGGIVTIRGNGFTPMTQVIVTVDGAAPTLTIADSSGAFFTPLSTQGLAAGAYQVTAKDGGGRQGTAGVLVTAPPTPTPTPTPKPVETVVTIQSATCTSTLVQNWASGGSQYEFTATASGTASGPAETSVWPTFSTQYVRIIISYVFTSSWTGTSGHTRVSADPPSTSWRTQIVWRGTLYSNETEGVTLRVSYRYRNSDHTYLPSRVLTCR